MDSSRGAFRRAVNKLFNLHLRSFEYPGADACSWWLTHSSPLHVFLLSVSIFWNTENMFRKISVRPALFCQAERYPFPYPRRN